jgi:hypothetical protein
MTSAPELDRVVSTRPAQHDHLFAQWLARGRRQAGAEEIDGLHLVARPARQIREDPARADHPLKPGSCFNAIAQFTTCAYRG